MLPKIDSQEWKELWNMDTKVNALNEAIQCLQECLDGKLGQVIEEEIEAVREVNRKPKKKSR